MAASWVLLDRDGVINFDSDSYIKSAEEWIPLPGSIEAIADLKNAGYQIAVITNQSGLGRGLFDLDDLEAMHEKLQSLLAESGCCLDAIFYCPHLPEDQCACRKPATGLLDALESEFDISVEGSWFVGDDYKDLQLAHAKKCLPALVLTGKGSMTRPKHSSDTIFKQTPVFKDLREFADFLLDKEQI